MISVVTQEESLTTDHFPSDPGPTVSYVAGKEVHHVLHEDAANLRVQFVAMSIVVVGF